MIQEGLIYFLDLENAQNLYVIVLQIYQGKSSSSCDHHDRGNAHVRFFRMNKNTGERKVRAECIYVMIHDKISSCFVMIEAGNAVIRLACRRAFCDHAIFADRDKKYSEYLS
jgi:hypothetical protein